METSTPATLLLAVLELIAGGVFGGMIGLFVGWGITSEGEYVYDDTVQHGEILMRAIVEFPRGSAAWRIMRQVAIEART